MRCSVQKENVAKDSVLKIVVCSQMFKNKDYRSQATDLFIISSDPNILVFTGTSIQPYYNKANADMLKSEK